ncbi:hypothetical protein BJX96DRAFT_155786 [Aspergillus floccosus]
MALLEDLTDSPPSPTCRFSFNFIACKRLGAHHMSHSLNEATSELRDFLMSDLAAQSEEAKL